MFPTPLFLDVAGDMSVFPLCLISPEVQLMPRWGALAWHVRWSGYSSGRAVRISRLVLVVFVVSYKPEDDERGPFSIALSHKA